MLVVTAFEPEPWPQWLDEARAAYARAHPRHHRRTFAAIRRGTPDAFTWQGAFRSGDPMNGPHFSDPLPSQAAVHEWFRNYGQYLVG